MGFDHRFLITNIVACLVHFGSAVAAMALATTTVAYLAASAGFVSGTMHVFATRGITGNTNAFRWVDYCVSSTLMLAAIGLLVSMDTNALILVCLVNFFMMVSVGSAEPRPTPWIFWFNCVIYVLAVWLPVFLAVSIGCPPGFVYAIVVGLFLLYACVAVIYVLYSVYGHIATAVAEALYVVASLAAKVVLQWTIIGGVEFGNDTAVFAVLGAAVVGGALLARPMISYLSCDTPITDV